MVDFGKGSLSFNLSRIVTTMTPASTPGSLSQYAPTALHGFLKPGDMYAARPGTLSAGRRSGQQAAVQAAVDQAVPEAAAAALVVPEVVATEAQAAAAVQTESSTNVAVYTG